MLPRIYSLFQQLARFVTPSSVRSRLGGCSLFIALALAFFVSNANSHQLQFKEFSTQANLHFTHQQTSKYLSSITESLGSGVCVEDFNKDGLLDIFLVGGSGFTREYGKKSWWHEVKGHRLFLASAVTKDQVFYQDSSEASKFERSWGMACAVADFDADGLPDLLVLNLGENQLYRNTGKGVFTLQQGFTKESSKLWSTSASIHDVNGDGQPDIYITNYVDYEKGKRVFETSRGFDPVKKSDFDASLYDSQANQLLINQGGFKFVDQAESYKLSDSSGRSLGSIWTDINADGRDDLVVLNDSGSLSRVFLKKGAGFEAAADVPGLSGALGNRQLLVTDVLGDAAPELLLATSQGFPRKVLHKEGRGYRDLAWDLGLATPWSVSLSGWGVDSADFDRDGKSDLIYSSGQAAPDLDSSHVAVGQPVQIFLNGEANHFDLPSFNLGYETSNALSQRSVVTSDFDNDGDYDWLVTANNGPVRIYLNESKTIHQHWFGLRVAVSEAHEALTVTFDDASIKRYSLKPVSLFMGQRPANVVVSWPEGRSLKRVTLEGGAAKKSLPLPVSGRYYQLKAEELEQIDSTSAIENESSWSEVDIKHDLLSAAFSSRSRSMVFAKDGIERFGRVYRWALGQDNHSSWPFVVNALASGSEELKLVAVDWIHRSEPELGVYSLMDVVSDTHASTKLRCSAAQTLEHFYREEEAVTHRKYLAVPVLIKLLASSDKVLQNCVILALAEAEAYRAIQPLANLLNQKNKSVALKAAYALGRTRHLSSEKAVLKAIEQTEDEDLQIALLIALSRLNSKYFDHWFQNVFSHSRFSEKVLDRKVAALNLNPEGRLFLLRDLTTLWANHNEFLALLNRQSDSLQSGKESDFSNRAWNQLLSDSNFDYTNPAVIEFCERAADNTLDIKSLPEVVDSQKVERVLNCALRQKVVGAAPRKAMSLLANKLLSSKQKISAQTAALMAGSTKVLLYKPLVAYLTRRENIDQAIAAADEICGANKTQLKTRSWMIKSLTELAVSRKSAQLVKSITACRTDEANDILFKALSNPDTAASFRVDLAWHLLDVDYQRVAKVIKSGEL